MGRTRWLFVIAAVALIVAQRLQAACVFSRLVGPDAALPKAVTDAIMLLGWSGDDVPPIVMVAQRPADAGPTAEAWVRFDQDGHAMPVIYVRTDTDVYFDASKGDYQGLVRLAGVLAHERWHLRHGRDEVSAYTVQLSVMEYLHANSMRLAEVRRALARVRRQAQK